MCADAGCCGAVRPQVCFLHSERKIPKPNISDIGITKLIFGVLPSLTHVVPSRSPLRPPLSPSDFVPRPASQSAAAR